jgi:hypothetical protein
MSRQYADSVVRGGDYRRSTRLRWARAKFQAKAWLKRCPRFEPAVTKIWRYGRLLFYECKWWRAGLAGRLRGTYAKGVDVEKVFLVSPQTITHCTLGNFKGRDFKGCVVGGDWDRLEKRFEDLDVYAALQQVCIQGEDWSNTAFYQRRLERLDRGDILWYARDKSALDKRCRDRESLFRTIRGEGYRSQNDLLCLQRISDPVQAADEVTVCIGRHGDLLFSDGIHRLAIAKLLGVNTIPVRVALRHPDWMALREELMQYAEGHGGRLPQPLLHPDLRDIPACQECEVTFAKIRDTMSTERGCLLDVGAGLGYYCHRFEDEGFNCHAAESRKDEVSLLTRLRRAGNKSFKITAASIPDPGELSDARFDVVLALHAFQRVSERREDLGKFVDLLKEADVHEFYFEEDLPSGRRSRSEDGGRALEVHVEFVLRNTELDRVDCVGGSHDGRTLYRVHRSARKRLSSEHRGRLKGEG